MTKGSDLPHLSGRGRLGVGLGHKSELAQRQHPYPAGTRTVVWSQKASIARRGTAGRGEALAGGHPRAGTEARGREGGLGAAPATVAVEQGPQALREHQRPGHPPLPWATVCSAPREDSPAYAPQDSIPPAASAPRPNPGEALQHWPPTGLLNGPEALHSLQSSKARDTLPGPSLLPGREPACHQQRGELENPAQPRGGAQDTAGAPAANAKDTVLPTWRPAKSAGPALLAEGLMSTGPGHLDLWLT